MGGTDLADIVIFGSGQLADVAKAYLDRFSEDRVVGFTVDAAYLDQPRRHGLPVVAWETLEMTFPPDQVLLLGPLSYQRLNRFRRDRHLEAKARGYGFASFVHPSAHNMAQAVGAVTVRFAGPGNVPGATPPGQPIKDNRCRSRAARLPQGLRSFPPPGLS